MRSFDMSPQAAAERALERELAELEAAIALVDSGKTRSVTIAGVQCTS